MWTYEYFTQETTTSSTPKSRTMAYQIKQVGNEKLRVLITHHYNHQPNNIHRFMLLDRWGLSTRKWELLQSHQRLCSHNPHKGDNMKEEIGYPDHGVGYLDPDLHDPAILYSEDYPDTIDEYYDEYYIENLYELEELLKEEEEEKE